jgi:hypothetical protein
LTEVNLFLDCENEFGRFGLLLLDEGGKNGFGCGCVDIAVKKVVMVETW